jgi:hypothetical protein
MPVWKVLFIMAFACACLALALTTVIVPATLVEGGQRWLWLSGLLLATTCAGTLLALFLRHADKALQS